MMTVRTTLCFQILNTIQMANQKCQLKAWIQPSASVLFYISEALTLEKVLWSNCFPINFYHYMCI